MGERRSTFKTLTHNLQDRNFQPDLAIDGRTILEQILKNRYQYEELDLFGEGYRLYESPLQLIIQVLQAMEFVCVLLNIFPKRGNSKYNF